MYTHEHLTMYIRILSNFIFLSIDSFRMTSFSLAVLAKCSEVVKFLWLLENMYCSSVFITRSVSIPMLTSNFS